MDNLKALKAALAKHLPLITGRPKPLVFAVDHALEPLALLGWLNQSKSGCPLLCITADRTARRSLIGQVRTWAALIARSDALQGAIHEVGDQQWAFLDAIQQSAPVLLIADSESILEALPTSDELLTQTMTLRTGQRQGLEKLFRRLVQMGFEPVFLVDQIGQLAKRGGILDVFMRDQEFPLRIEFWEDTVHSLRWFNTEDQRSLYAENNLLTSVIIPPLRPTTRSAKLADYLPSGTVLIGEPRMLLTLPASERYLQIQLVESAQDALSLQAESLPTLRSRTKEFIQSLVESTRRGRRISIISQHASRLQELVTDSSERLYGGLLTPENQKILAGVEYIPLAETSFPIQGFDSAQLDYTVYTDVEIFGLVRTHAPSITRQKSYYLRYLEDIAVGDYVVHEDHGIGRYDGIQTMEIQGATREYASIAFANTDRVYLPITQLQKVAKYIGGDEDQLQLSKLGGRKWKAQKKRAERDTALIARQLLTIYARRQAATGFAFPDDAEMSRALRASFPYMETRDQQQAIEDVFKDMSTDQPMDRLLCGDVGFGKTEVSLRAAFRAVLAGKQVAMLCPTTILADQHFQTYLKRLDPFGVKVGLLSRFRTKRENQHTIRDIALGKVDVVIGTHRLLSDDVIWHDLGLLIIDEEQRFGVMHKDRIQSLRAGLDVLAMTATPIPRTLHLSLVGIRDVSILVSPPQGRRSVKTIIEPYNERLLQSVVEAELERGGQVFIVYNLVRSIDSFARRVADLVPSARIIVGHGQLGAEEIESKMQLFVEGHVDVLVASRIIENGMDIPTANTMIVVGAEAFGLATLHQFRGRVGRSSEQAFAYFLSYQEPLSRSASKRLEALRETAELGAGFQIAMRDLEIRGAGNILGVEQSGHIDGIGFELYSRLLSKAIRAQKQVVDQEIMPSADDDLRCTVELPLTAYFSDDFIGQAEEKIALYRRLLDTRSVEANQQFAAELIDRFGPLPPPAANSLQINHLRILAILAGIDSIQIQEDWLVCHFANSTILPSHVLGPHWQTQRESGIVRIRQSHLGSEWVSSLESGLLALATNH